MKPEKGVYDKLRSGPLARLHAIVRLDMSIDFEKV